MVEFQRCIVHMIRNTVAYVSYKDRKELCSDLKKIYTAPDADAGYEKLLELQEKWEKMRDVARPRAVNLSDLLLETVLRPEVEDYFDEEANAKVPNPLIDLYNRAKSMIDLLEDYEYITSDYRIVYWLMW